MAITRKPDKTRNERQARRRIREKEWLKEHGFNSWEALHTSLMKDETRLTKREPDKAHVSDIPNSIANYFVVEVDNPPHPPCG